MNFGRCILVDKIQSDAIFFKVIHFISEKCKKKIRKMWCGRRWCANHNHFEGRQSPLDYCRNIYKNRWYYQNFSYI